MDKHLVMCPFCDSEQREALERNVVRCVRCGKAFHADPWRHGHPEEFWANPDTSARF